MFGVLGVYLNSGAASQFNARINQTLNVNNFNRKTSELQVLLYSFSVQFPSFTCIVRQHQDVLILSRGLVLHVHVAALEQVLGAALATARPAA